jgi:hypothetical protein
MSDADNTPDAAAMPPASAGSHGDTLVKALRILARDIYCEDGIATQCIREAAKEIELLHVRVVILETAIRRLAEQDATLSVCDGNVTVTMDGTLTDEERDAIEFAIRKSTRLRDGGKTGAALRGLLERLG